MDDWEVRIKKRLCPYRNEEECSATGITCRDCFCPLKIDK